MGGGLQCEEREGGNVKGINDYKRKEEEELLSCDGETARTH